MRLEANKLRFRYDRRSPWVLDGVDFSVSAGERTAIVAPSGFGKSTLALLLAGYLSPTGGQILLDGAPLPKKGLCPVQLIYQHPERAINPRWLDRFPRELSGGELQRFCVARALMSGAPLLICDEISTMLDVITQAQIWNRILAEAEKRGMGLVAVTHNMALAKRVCTSVFDLEKQEYMAL